MERLLILPVFLLTSHVQAGNITPKVVTCGDKGTAQTNIVAGNEDYFATINVPKEKGPTFQVHAKLSLKTGFSCSPDVSLIVVGTGTGDHPNHEISVEDGSNIIFNVNDTDTSYDWAFKSDNGMSCDYSISMDWSITCGPPLPPPPPPPPPPSSGIPTWLTWWATMNSTQVTKSGQTATATGIAAWDTAPGSLVNKTSWTGEGDTFVADFNKQIVYNTLGTVCQYTCQMEGGENSCDSAMDGGAFCGFDYETRSKLLENVTLPNGEVAEHYYYDDPLGPVSMAGHDLYLSVKTGLPLRFKASYHPFGKFVENVTSDYSNFKITSPPSKYFEVTQVPFCIPGNSQQCANSLARVRQLGLQFGVPVLKHQLMTNVGKK